MLRNALYFNVAFHTSILFRIDQALPWKDQKSNQLYSKLFEKQVVNQWGMVSSEFGEENEHKE